MLLDELVDVIETLQRRIRDHGPNLRENETRTRMALIDPLLRVLGWDVSDPSVVTPEYSVSGRWADYALLGPDGRPVATVEAKKLGEPLAQHRMQMLNYSNASGVEYAGLTDGDHWELYEVFQRGQLEDRRILDVSIATTRHTSARYGSCSFGGRTWHRDGRWQRMSLYLTGYSMSKRQLLPAPGP